jgi:hypothetical protein
MLMENVLKGQEKSLWAAIRQFFDPNGQRPDP